MNLDYFDETRLQERFGVHDEAIRRRLIRVFLVNLVSLSNDLKQAMAQRDPTKNTEAMVRLRYAAHKLYSSAHYIGADKLSQRLGGLMDSLDDSTPDEAEKLLAVLSSTIETTQSDIMAFLAKENLPQ